MFRVSTFTRTEETGRALGMLLDLLKDFRQNPATADEMKEAKAYLIGSFVMGSETPGQVAGRVIAVAKYGLASDYWDKYRDRIQAVTAEQVAAAVKRHVDPEKMTIVAVGNASRFAKSLETLGTSRTILFSDLDLRKPDLR
jgi:predicted Zn-dependent peptidase